MGVSARLNVCCQFARFPPIAVREQFNKWQAELARLKQRSLFLRQVRRIIGNRLGNRDTIPAVHGPFDPADIGQFVPPSLIGGGRR